VCVWGGGDGDGETPATCTGGMLQEHDLEPDRREHTHELERDVNSVVFVQRTKCCVLCFYSAYIGNDLHVQSVSRAGTLATSIPMTSNSSYNPFMPKDSVAMSYSRHHLQNVHGIHTSHGLVHLHAIYLNLMKTTN
jgi:hypothetical protein